MRRSGKKAQTSGYPGLLDARAEAQGMADGVGQLGAVQRVEVKLVYAVLAQPLHLFYRDIRRDHPARVGIVVQPVKSAAQPIGHRSAAAGGEGQELRKTRGRKNFRK